MFNNCWPETPANHDDSVSARGRAEPVRTMPIDLAFVVGAIRGHAPELSDDLDEAITGWLAQTSSPADRRTGLRPLTSRRSRLQALRELLHLSAYEPDPRD
jgi:hypothetical protein